MTFLQMARVEMGWMVRHFPTFFKYLFFKITFNRGFY